MTAKTLVVPLDGSEFAERALPVAQAIVERIGGRLLLVSAQYHGPLEPHAYLEECAALNDRCPVEVLATKETYAAQIIDEKIKKYMADCYEISKKLIIQNKELIEQLSVVLLDKEYLTKEEFESMITNFSKPKKSVKKTISL